ncbi:hypothetical protein RGR602_CH03503 [Rhizobium gallicum bv. gallicum R602sp]|uniref:Uncharacterized protein n=1 Tax=Rhizobium gallicum bv. gallicum R602sp TaxID=1041138 RepID=A0A0B4X7U6_9HYPH|nr:hypothetical protein RGR602_CH03503 [Rhizobium gallicum bv. gallicum R602sp]
MNSALPGYLMVGSKAPASELSELQASALAELGPLLAKVEDALPRFCRRGASTSADMDTPRATDPFPHGSDI